MPSCDRGRQIWNDLKLKAASKGVCEVVWFLVVLFGLVFFFSPDNFHRILQDRTQYKSLASCQV